MENLKKVYIQQVFENIIKLKMKGIYFSGIVGEGEYKEWWDSLKLWIHSWYRKGSMSGEMKKWASNGELMESDWIEDGQVAKLPKNVKLKEGYMLGGDGKYYKD